MPSNYDEVVKKNKQYLTSAQINALAAASKEFNISNAGRRAEAQTSLRDQYDAGYRGLQNMGLAGAVGGQPTSGEIPRLEQQIKTPFDNYNQKLQQVENQRLSALGANYAAQTQAARAAAAAAAAERARIAAAEAESQRRGERYFEPRQQQSTSDSFIGPPTRQQWQEQQNRQNQYMSQLQWAASALGVPTPNLPTQIKQTNATGAAKNNIVSAARDAATKNPATAFKTAPDAMKQQHAEMRQAESVLRTGKGYDTAADKNALAQAEKQLENLKWTRHYGGRSAVSDADFNAAQAAVDAARRKVEKPQVYAAFVIKNSPTASAADKSKATGIVASYQAEEMTKALGYSKPTMTDKEFQDNAKIVPDVRRYLDIIDSQRIAQENKRKTGTTGWADYEQRDIDDALAELKKLGYTEDQARKFISDFDNNRSAKRDYDTFNDAYRSFYEHQGERPTKGLNNNETDPTYRAVNNMPDLAVMDYNSRVLDNPQLGPVDKLWTQQEQALGNVDYMTKEQRDAYNAIYEKDGIEAANKYANDIKPLVEMKRAADDDKFLKQLAKEHGVQAWALARATNLISNVPAMGEKLVIGAANIVNDIATGGTNVPIRYSPDSAMSRASNWADIIQSEQSRAILQHYDEIGWPGLGKIVNFGYSTGTSMVDSGIAMLISGMGASWLTDVLFLSSAGNSAYKDAIERGGTQEQALAFSVLSGTAEALFERVSIEHFLKDLKFSGPKAVQLIKSMLSQGGTEASEEVCTEIANILADVWVMGDKSEFEQLKQQPGGERGAYMALLKNAGSAALGGLASGLGFGAISMLRSAPGRILQRAEINDIGDQVIKSKGVQNLVDTARLLGGEASSLADKVSKKETNANVGDLAVKVAEMQRELYKNEQNGVPRSNEHAQDREVMVTRLLDGGKMDAFEAKDIMGTIGTGALSKLGYDVSSPRAFKNSYNAILQKYGIDSKAGRMSSVEGNLFASRTGSATYVQTHPTGLGMQRSGEAAAQYRSRQAAANYTGALNSASMRVWKDPNMGYFTTGDGQRALSMPGNMTAVDRAEQERSGFKARTTATKGRVTYAMAGMETRQGLNNAQKYNEIQKGLTKEAKQNAQFYEKLAEALGTNIVIHDAIQGVNAYIDSEGTMHVVLSSKQSVLRIAAHELTHLMKRNASAEYATMRKHLIAEVGQDRFDRMLRQKARDYGIDLSTEQGKALADDEVCAELCERMLSNEEALETFAEKNTAAAKTLKEHLLKILNAIKAAFKQLGNRDFGQSWSDFIEQQATVESWITGLQKAIENAERGARVETKASTETQAKADELYMSEADEASSEQKKKAQASGEKGTYVRGYTSAEVEKVVKAGVVGTRSNYEGEDYDRARSMVAQLIPDVVDALKGQADLDEAQSKVKSAVSAMLETYYEDEGDHRTLRDTIPEVIAVDATAKGDLAAQDQSLFQMSSKLKKALGRKVTLIGPDNAQYSSAEKLEEVWERVRDRFGLSDEQDFSIDTTKLLDFIRQQTNTRKTYRDVFGSHLQDEIDTITGNIVEAVADMLTEKEGVEYSLDTDRARKNGRYDKVSQFEEHKYFAGITGKMNEQNPTGYTKVGEIKEGSIYTRIGLPAGTTFFDNSKILKELNKKHDPLPVEYLKQVPRILAHPTVIVEADKANTVSVFGEIRMESGAPVLVGIMAVKDGSGRNVITKVRTVHPRLSDLGNIITDSSVLYITEDKKKAKDWFQTSRIEMPLSGTKFGFIRSIALSDDLVNRFSLDTDYMRLAEKYKAGDRNAEKKLKDAVQKAAAAAGYDSPLLYHGTNAFGFKSFDLTKGEGYIFASSSRDTAETYSGVTNRSQIADESKINVDDLHGEQLLREAQKHLDGYAGYELMTVQDRENATNHARRELTKTLERAAEFVNDNEGAFNEGKMAVMNDLLNALSNLSDAHTEDELMDAWDKWQGAIWDLKDLDDSIAVEFLQAIYSQNLALQKRHLDDLLYTGDLYKDRGAIGNYVFDNQLALELDAALHKGIYSLYGKTGSSLVINANGNNWNQIQAPEELQLYGPQKTRSLADAAFALGYDSVTIKNVRDNGGETSYNGLGDIYIFNAKNAVKSADPVTYDDQGNIIPLSERFNQSSNDIRYSLDTDEARQAFTMINTEGIEDGLEALKGVKHVGTWALKDISRFLDATAGKDKDLRNTLSAFFEKPHSQATGNYARGVERMQRRVLDIATRAGVVGEKGKRFDSKKSAAIQNIGEGFSNTYTDLKVKVKSPVSITVRAYEPGTEKLVVSERDYTLRQLREAYGTNAADYVWDQAFADAEKARATGKDAGWTEQTVNTRPYTMADLQRDFGDDWQKLKQAADEFRSMYDEYIRDQNNMLATIYPIESEVDSEAKLEKEIKKKEDRLVQRKTGAEVQIKALQENLEAKEKEIANSKRTDTKKYRTLVDQANRLTAKIEEARSDISEYEANVKEELAKMNALKAAMQNDRQHGDDSLKRMHRLQYRSDYFHHFMEMTSGVQNLKAIFTSNTDQDISPKIVGKSENTKAKSKWAGYFQQRMGGDYTADAINGMLRYGQLAEYKLAFDPLVAYLRDVNKQIRDINDDTNRDGLIRYIDQWADAIAGKSHKLDRMISDAGMAPRKAMQILNWINSRVIQNTLLFNMRSSLIQISNITNAKGLVTNNRDWMDGLRCWSAAAKGDSAMQAIMAKSNFLASRYMDNLQLTDSKIKQAKEFGGWMLGALDEISAKATWWAAYSQYARDPNAKVIQNGYRTYDNAIDYADDVTRRTHAGRGVGELAPAMTSRVINFVAPFQVEVNNTFELFKDNVKRGNYLGLLSTGLSVFLFNTVFEAIVGSSPLQFDFIRAVLDIVLGFVNDDPEDDDDDYSILQAWQRLAGEAFGSLPYAGQIASIIGEDVAKKIFGEDNDATRYGNTQIGISAVMNAGKGLYDIGKNLAEGKNVRQINWITDLDDLVNLTLPMGGKQLTRSIQGLYTVAQGYAGSNDKEGNEKVQFVTDQDVGHYIHAGLFGKWALTEASEYFGEKRFLPQLFGKYDGPKSSIGKTVDAKEYKAALETGINGHQYFDLKYDLSEYSTAGGKREEMMNQKLTADQKARLDFLLITSHGTGTKVENGVLYKQDEDGTWKQSAKAAGGILYGVNSQGDWEVKTDYTSRDMYDLSVMGSKIYGATKGLIAGGFDSDQALTAARVWYDTKDTPDEIEGVDDRKLAFRRMLFDSNAYTAAQKQQLDAAYCETKHQADYTDKELFELSTGGNYSRYEKAAEAKKLGVPVATYEKLSDKKAELTEKNKQNNDGESVSKAMRREIMDSNLTAKQKEALDDLLVSDKGQNPDYSSPTWFEISMLGGGQYKEAKDGEKVGLKPETYLTVYKKWKTLDAKDENGNTRSGLKKKRAKEYLDSLPISAPVYDYIWTAVFGYKSR